MKNCENCGNEHKGEYGSGRFCSKKCAKGFSTKAKRKEINEKVRNKLSKIPSSLICKNCGGIFIQKNKSSKFCSIKCANIFNKQLLSYKIKHSENLKKMWQNESYKKNMIEKLKIYNNKYEVKEKKRLDAKNRIFSIETRKKLSDAAIKNNLGGHTSKKKLYYKTKNDIIIYLQSSYEIKIAQELDNNNILWNRPEYLYWTDKNNSTHKYYPDFYLINFDVYLDSKNDYLIQKDKEKIFNVKNQNNINLFILDKNQLQWEIIKEIIAENKSE